jgi:hypothetical protein
MTHVAFECFLNVYCSIFYVSGSEGAKSTLEYGILEIIAL